MPADIDVLVGGSSPIGFAPNYPFESEKYRVSPNVLSPESPDSSRSVPLLDFPTVLGSSPNSGNYLGHSPPIFGTSPPTHFTFHGRCSSPTLRRPPVPSSPVAIARSFNQLRLSSSDNQISHYQMPVAVPLRPCLVVRCDVLNLESPGRIKKKVAFADDKGFPLALVRTMTEPSNVPPQLSARAFAKTCRRPSEVSVSAPWQVTFSQPASDYLDFRRRLDTDNVSLENVIVKESEQIVFGTVKVRNLAYRKEVFVRLTADDWRTHEDAFCTYVPNSPPALGVAILYDTFSFRLTLSPKSKKIEFCVCFRCSGNDYWDNNNGKNYVVSKKDDNLPPRYSRSQTDGNFDSSSSNGKIKISRRFSDELKPDVQLESWTEFATWNHLNNDSPYW